LSQVRTNVQERFCSAIQYLLCAYQLRLLGLELYRVVESEGRIHLKELDDPRDLAPYSTLMVVIPYERQGRSVELHAKYHLTEDQNLVEDFFGVMCSDIYPGEDPAQLEALSIPVNLRSSTIGVFSELVRQLAGGPIPQKIGANQP